MAARKTVKLSSEWRERIKAGEIIERMQRCALGEIEMTATQIRAAETLLRKALPDLSSVEYKGELNVNSVTELTDAALAAIASRGSAGTDKPQGKQKEPTGLH